MWNFIGEEGGKGKVRKIEDENGIEVYCSHPSESNNGMDEGYDSSTPAFFYSIGIFTLAAA